MEKYANSREKNMSSKMEKIDTNPLLANPNFKCN